MVPRGRTLRRLATRLELLREWRVGARAARLRVAEAILFWLSCLYMPSAHAQADVLQGDWRAQRGRTFTLLAYDHHVRRRHARPDLVP